MPRTIIVPLILICAKAAVAAVPGKFSKSLIMREYRGLMDNIGAKGSSGPLISPDYFHSGCTFFCFDLTPDQVCSIGFLS